MLLDGLTCTGTLTSIIVGITKAQYMAMHAVMLMVFICMLGRCRNCFHDFSVVLVIPVDLYDVLHLQISLAAPLLFFAMPSYGFFSPKFLS